MYQPPPKVLSCPLVSCVRGSMHHGRKNWAVARATGLDIFKAPPHLGAFSSSRLERVLAHCSPPHIFVPPHQANISKLASSSADPHLGALAVLIWHGYSQPLPTTYFCFASPSAHHSLCSVCRFAAWDRAATVARTQFHFFEHQNDTLGHNSLSGSEQKERKKLKN